MELLNELEKLQNDLEKQANEQNEPCHIMDIEYYKHITLDKATGEKEPLYLIEKEVDGKLVRQLQLGDKVIADINEDNTICMREGEIQKTGRILMQLNNITPISLRALQEREQLPKRSKKQEKEEKKDNKKANDKPKNEEEKQPGQQNPYAIAEIDLDKPIVGTKTFRDLVPEVEEKEVEKVKVRRTGLGTDNAFEFYGIGKEGEYIKLESLKRTEATNQTKEVNEIRDGKVQKNKVSAMFQLTNGTNEGHGNEGFTIDLEDGTGIPEVSYYRRARNFDETEKDATRYESIPVNMKDTNQKRTELYEREHMEKKRNTDIGDNVERSNEILEAQDETTLSNIDDSPYNDNMVTMEEYIKEQITQAAESCKVSEKGFMAEMEKVVGTTGEGLEQTIQQAIQKGYKIEELIEEAKANIEEQAIGGNGRVI